MIHVLRALIAFACNALPSSHRSHYRHEWTAELYFIACESGNRAALGFVLSLLVTAPRTAVTLWSDPSNPFRETTFAVMAILLPCVFFFGYGVISRQPGLLLAHSGLLAGVSLIAIGMTRNLRQPLHSITARLGLALAIGFGVMLTMVNQSGAVSNPVLQGAFRVYPGSWATMLGFALLLTAGICAPIRRQAIQAGLIFIGGGAFVWTLLVMVNAALATSWIDRAFQLVTAPALMAASYAAWKAFGRSETYRSGYDERTAIANL